ncbi:MAG: RNA polymerase sigma factor [Anaerolineales bacterium]|nr:RNA polymerase sigma factor [Anaerolineales bacterium]
MPSWENIADAELVKRAQGGDAGAFGEIYERHARSVFRFFAARLNNPLDAEDLTEELFIRVWRSLPNYREKGVPFTAFLFRIANNALIDHYRKINSPSSEVSLEGEGLHDSNHNPEDLATKSLEQAALKKVLDELRDDYREVLILRFLSELSPDETAKAMDRSVGAVRILQHRALIAVRNLMENNKDLTNLSNQAEST